MTAQENVHSEQGPVLGEGPLTYVRTVGRAPHISAGQLGPRAASGGAKTMPGLEPPHSTTIHEQNTT
ncbi:hypothetical protein A9K55_006073 [Cordyceps militaris]|uniref:Uncharacterized protein n=1 Tax=Cordyceps militaris TaxID=73501 RepID=A0A2H4SC74_CORMI|nr:hypothetical protein A9K55_006073 [Cordyceps militaris]